MPTVVRKFYEITLDKEDGSMHSFTQASKNFTDCLEKIEKSTSPVVISSVSSVQIRLGEGSLRCYE
jgi:hypothetical protein